MENLILWVGLALLFAALVLAVVANKNRKGQLRQPPVQPDYVQLHAPQDELPYQKKKYLLTKAERCFYETLCQAIGHDGHLFAKVRLSDLVYLPRGTQNSQAYNNKVQSKHVDFVLCDRENVSPILAVELDDSSHLRDDRRERDIFVDELFRRIGLPLVRIPVRASYDANELAMRIREGMGR